MNQERGKQFIFAALNLRRDLPTAEAIAAMQQEDWNYLLQMAKAHRLGPMLHEKLARGDLAASIPADVLEYLQAARRKNALRSLKVYRQLASVTQILDSAQIPSIALKGAYLARFAYPDPGLRPMRDLDLLLRPEQAIDAFNLLAARGYRPIWEGSPEAHLLVSHHLPQLASPDGIIIELHHRLSDPHPSYTNEFAEKLWQRSRPKTIGGTHINFLCPEDLLLHLCIHAALNHDLNVGPLALADVAALAASGQVDWQDFISLVSAGNWQHCALSLLYMAKRHLDADIPDQVIDKLGGMEGNPFWLESAEYLLFSELGDHKLLTDKVSLLLYHGNFFAKISALFEMLFPSRTIIARDFPVSANSPTVFLYYPWRWYRLLTEKTPLLFQALSGRKESIRQLQQHQNALRSWLQDRSASRPPIVGMTTLKNETNNTCKS